MNSSARVCAWRFDGEQWLSECGNKAVIGSGSPEYSGMLWCCFCGKPLVEVVTDRSNKEPVSVSVAAAKLTRMVGK